MRQSPTQNANDGSRKRSSQMKRRNRQHPGEGDGEDKIHAETRVLTFDKVRYSTDAGFVRTAYSRTKQAKGQYVSYRLDREDSSYPTGLFRLIVSGRVAPRVGADARPIGVSRWRCLSHTSTLSACAWQLRYSKSYAISFIYHQDEMCLSAIVPLLFHNL